MNTGSDISRKRSRVLAGKEIWHCSSANTSCVRDRRLFTKTIAIFKLYTDKEAFFTIPFSHIPSYPYLRTQSVQMKKALFCYSILAWREGRRDIIYGMKLLTEAQWDVRNIDLFFNMTWSSYFAKWLKDHCKSTYIFMYAKRNIERKAKV